MFSHLVWSRWSLPSANANTVFPDRQGSVGSGLLPGNQPGGGVSSGAFGGEVGTGLLFDELTNELAVAFDFSGLTGGGLANAADGGIHIHAASGDPFTTNGGVVFNLNPGAANVALGSTSGSINQSFTLTEEQKTTLLNGAYYVNIHSGAFPGGELRGNLVVGVPEPTSALAIGIGLLGLTFRRRRKPSTSRTDA